MRSSCVLTIKNLSKMNYMETPGCVVLGHRLTRSQTRPEPYNRASAFKSLRTCHCLTATEQGWKLSLIRSHLHTSEDICAEPNSCFFFGKTTLTHSLAYSVDWHFLFQWLWFPECTFIVHLCKSTLQMYFDDDDDDAGLRIYGPLRTEENGPFPTK